MSLGSNIKAKRKALKLSQEYVAEQLGVSRQAVSKWETGQSEPTASNLVELARLFDVSITELAEPEDTKSASSPKRKPVFAILALASYSASAILYTIETSDSGFTLYATVLMLISAAAMAFNIIRLPADVRKRMAIQELCYCIVIYCIVTFLEPVIRNVYTSLVILACCVLYAKHFRFKDFN